MEVVKSNDEQSGAQNVEEIEENESNQNVTIVTTLSSSPIPRIDGDPVTSIVEKPTISNEPVSEPASVVEQDVEPKQEEVIESMSKTEEEPLIQLNNDESESKDDNPIQNVELTKQDQPAMIPIKGNAEGSLQTTEQISKQPRESTEKKKEDEKTAIYKALAIKLKKELVKCRDELQKLRDESQKECKQLNEKVETLEKALEMEQQTSTNTILTLEAKNKSLKHQVEVSDSDLQALQIEFENYKANASQIMQRNNPQQFSSNKTIEDERFKQLKELDNKHQKRISNLESQLTISLEKNRELEQESRAIQKKYDDIQEELRATKNLDSKIDTLSRENENLKHALKQYRSKLKEPSAIVGSSTSCDESCNEKEAKGLVSDMGANTATKSTIKSVSILANDESGLEHNSAQISPSVSVKGGSQTNSSSSLDGSTSGGYVHIKPTPFEIISRSSVLEDAQNQIDNLTKAYLDSENTNSLLTEQVLALKEEIRRLQRGTERMDLAENLEYLKNILFKYLTLESGQVEQKQRLIPVLSTVLKLSPDETSKLQSMTVVDKPSMASSFFKL